MALLFRRKVGKCTRTAGSGLVIHEYWFCEKWVLVKMWNTNNIQNVPTVLFNCQVTLYSDEGKFIIVNRQPIS